MCKRVFFAVIAVVFCLSLTAVADDKMSDADKAKMMEDPMMKAWMAYATPADQHKMMEKMVGTWDAEVTSWMDPTKPPTKSKATSTYTSIMGGRFLIEKVEGNMMDMPFEGMGVMGYDNMTKKYVYSWVDNMGTGIMTGEGKASADGKTINYTGKASDPMTGKVQTYRSVMHIMDDNKNHYEMFGPGPKGKEVKMMEITYTRKM